LKSRSQSIHKRAKGLTGVAKPHGVRTMFVRGMRNRIASASVHIAMTLIVSSLIAMLFDHHRTAAVTAPLPEPLCAQPAVIVVVDPPSPVAGLVVQSLVKETAAIWKPLGVEVRLDSAPDDGGDARVVRVVLSDERAPHDVVDQRLGWIRFGPSGEPESVIHLSRMAALDLLDGSPALRARPDAYRDVLLARMLGRALAHELGHYLLGSKGHTAAGLMRARWSVDALVAVERTGFEHL